jgi:hypothetical protein
LRHPTISPTELVEETGRIVRDAMETVPAGFMVPLLSIRQPYGGGQQCQENDDKHGRSPVDRGTNPFERPRDSSVVVGYMPSRNVRNPESNDGKHNG